MEALVGRDRRSQTAPQMLTAPGERRIVGNGEVETHYPEQRVQEPFGLAQREMVDEPQGQSGLDGEIRVAPLPTPPAAPAGRPGSDRFRGHPHRHIATANEGQVVGRLVRDAIFRLVRGMDLRLHPCSVAPAEGHEKCRPNRPTPAGSSCNNALSMIADLLLPALVHDSKLTVNDPNPEASHRPILYDSGRPSSGIWFRTLHATTDSATRPPRDRARSRSPIIDVYRKNAFSTRAWSW